MMLFKLSLKNMKKSFKDYAIYFLTLILGVAIFYMFNSLDSQEAMLAVNQSTRQIVELMVEMIAWVSVFVAAVLGFLIVYANNFMVKRRKKEFGLYMTLGMGKWQISKILLVETIVIGLLSLVVGMVVGVFGSQLMSVLVAKLFQADMSAYTFVFSKAAMGKTILYFGVMYVAVMLFNVITISKCKLIDLLTAVKKNEEVKMKNPIFCILVFLAAVGMLVWAYYRVTVQAEQLREITQLLAPVATGMFATFLVFWSMSGFILKVAQSKKKFYLKDTNLFVLRQVNNKINTTVFSMTVICLLLFMTISILSTSLSLNRVLTQDLNEMTPVDINLTKSANLPDNGEYSKKKVEDSYLPITDTLEHYGYDMTKLKDVEEITLYATDTYTWADFMGSLLGQVEEQYPTVNWNSAERIIKVSDYNRIAKLYGLKEYSLQEDEYIELCDYDVFVGIRNQALALKNKITINGKTYLPKYTTCQSGYVNMSTSHVNIGITLVPDSCPLTDDMKEYHFLAANYNADTEDGKQQIEQMFESSGPESKKMDQDGVKIDGSSRISIIESSKGLSTIITFIAIYLGVIFLIASSAILALKELSEHSDNRERYAILRKIGVDENMINQSLFKQIAIFFLMPLAVAVIHSIFGIQFALKLTSVQVQPKEMLPSVIGTAIFLVAIYGGYFFATYAGSKNIIKENV